MGQVICLLWASREPTTQSGEKYYTVFSLNLVHPLN